MKSKTTSLFNLVTDVSGTFIAPDEDNMSSKKEKTDLSSMSV